MRLSKFFELMNDEFGSQYSDVLMRDLVLSELGERSPSKAIEAGLDPKDVWFAICRAENVPQSRWHGLNKNTKKRHAE